MPRCLQLNNDKGEKSIKTRAKYVREQEKAAKFRRLTSNLFLFLSIGGYLYRGREPKPNWTDSSGQNMSDRPQEMRFPPKVNTQIGQNELQVNGKSIKIR